MNNEKKIVEHDFDIGESRGDFVKSSFDLKRKEGDSIHKAEVQRKKAEQKEEELRENKMINSPFADLKDKLS